MSTSNREYLEQAEAHADEGPLGEAAARSILRIALAQCDTIDRLEKWVADLQAGMYVNCVYCGHRYGPGETTPVSMADALKAHVVECPAHPMSGLVEALGAVLSLHGKPHRQEWLNDEAFRHAIAVHEKAATALAQVTKGPEKVGDNA